MICCPNGSTTPTSDGYENSTVTPILAITNHITINTSSSTYVSKIKHDNTAGC